MRCWRRGCCTRLKTEMAAIPGTVGQFTSRVGVDCDPRPGGAPGGAVTFFCLAKRKSPKKRPPPLPASQRYRTGKPAVLASGGVWLNSLRSDNASPDPPEAALLGASRGGPRGAGSGAHSAPSRLGRGTKTMRQSRSFRMQPPSPPPPVRDRRDARRSRADPDPAPRGPHLYAPRSAVECGSGLALFEPKASLARPRIPRAPQVPRRESDGAQTVGVAFLLVTFLWPSKEK